MPKRKPGRPSALTPQAQAAICKTLAKAGTLEDAAEVADVGEATVHRWMARGEQEQSGPYREFREAVKRAKSQRRVALEEGIRDAGEKSWQALAWLLERTEPKRYALRVRVQVDEELTHGIERLKEAFRDDPDGLERALSALAGSESGDGAERDAAAPDGSDDPGGEAVRSTSAELEAAGLPVPGR